MACELSNEPTRPVVRDRQAHSEQRLRAVVGHCDDSAFATNPLGQFRAALLGFGLIQHRIDATGFVTEPARQLDARLQADEIDFAFGNILTSSVPIEMSDQ